jgi:hypothetical protein
MKAGNHSRKEKAEGTAKCACVFLFLAVALLLFPFQARAQWDNVLKKLMDSMGSAPLSEAEISRGLKEALRVGSANTVALVSALDGYNLNPDIRILLPEDLRKIEGTLRSFGLGSQVDAFVLSMNRAAERAAPKARDIFLEAVSKISFDDAKRILEGRDNEATLYFREKTEGRLAEAFRPSVHEAMAEVGVTRIWQELDGQIRRIPFVAEAVRVDLDQYVTGKALDGLFFTLAQEEKKIRQDPAARVTDLLKKVFGKR